MRKVLSILMCTMSVSSCSVINYIAQTREYGKAFCNERYLDKNIVHFEQRELDVARSGFIYSTLGAIALQKNNYDSRSHLFKLPSSIKEIYSDNKLSGLQAKTFIVYDKVTNSPKELVIAFAGTNQFRDWLTNAQVSDKQFKQALDYYNKSVQREEVGDPKKLNKIVVTGYSLGGALAVSVGKNKNVVEKISEVWVFNPSPKSHTDYKKESNFWFGSARNDILKKVRTSEYMNLFESDHIYDDQFLIDSNAVYAHSRWVVARNMLWTADFSYITGESKEYDNPAYEIIQLSEFKSCKNK